VFIYCAVVFVPVSNCGVSVVLLIKKCLTWLSAGCSHSGVNSCRDSTWPSDTWAPYDSPSPAPSLPPVAAGVLCTEDFCRLGCVCDSIKRSVSPSEAGSRPRDHCGHADCMLDCTCTYKTRLRSGRMSLYDSKTAPGSVHFSSVTAFVFHAVL